MAVALAMFGLTVPWRRLQPHRRAPLNVYSETRLLHAAGDLVGFGETVYDDGRGVRVLARDHLAVSVREFANGSTQVWLKRRPA